MKLTLKVKPFLNAVAFAASAVASKTTLPALSHVLISGEGGTLSITGSDLDVYATAKVECETSQGGSICLPAKLLQAFLGSLTSEEITLELVKGKMKAASGSSHANFPTLLPEDFPTAPKITGNKADFSADTLAMKLGQVAHAQSDDTSRYVLNGVCFEFQNNLLSLVATDGRRLSMTSFDCKGEGRYIVPTKVVQVLSSALNNSEGDVAATFGTNMAEFSSDQWTVSGKLIDGNYPNYRQVIPNNSKPLTTNREALIQIVKRAQLFTDERQNSVKLFSDGKSIEVRSSNNDFTESIEASGVEFRVALQPDYLLDTLNAVQGDTVEFGVIDEISPLKVVEKDFTAVVMPMRMS